MSAQEQAEIDVAPDRVAEWLDGGGTVELIDVREQGEHEAGHIGGSRHIPLVRLSDEAPTIARERPVVFYCRVGSRSEMAAQAFRASGYEAYSMVGGLVRWAQEGRPLDPEGGHVADH
jgi:rhodanese-related sulfurtransferase